VVSRSTGEQLDNDSTEDNSLLGVDSLVHFLGRKQLQIHFK